MTLKRHCGKGRNPVISVCTGCRIRYPGLDPVLAVKTKAFSGTVSLI
jgi:hypothetical protein